MFFDTIEKHSNNIAIINDKNDCITYSELAKSADRICSLTSSREIVFILCRNTIEALIGYVGFIRNRIVPVMLDADIDAVLFDNLIEQYRPKYIYKPQDVTIDNIDNVLWKGDEYELISRSIEKAPSLHNDLALLITTSGSTGSPKLVRQTYLNIESNATSIASYLHLDSDERPITTLPMYYTYGLSIIHSHLLVGATILMTEYPINNKKFWDFFKSCEATSFGGVPYTYEMLNRVHFEKIDLPSLRTMTQAGGKLSLTLHELFGTYALKNNKNFVVMYGQTEATARMAYLPPENCLNKIGSIGIAIPGGKLFLKNVDGSTITDANVVGELVYSGDNVTLGYAQSYEDLSKEDELNGCLSTGDMAKMDEDGYFYIVGRKKRFLKLFGSRVNLDEMDMLITQQFPTLECATTGSDDRMLTFITDEAAIEEVKRFIINTTHINAAAVNVISCDEIPRNSSGKILYTKLEEQYGENN